MYVRFTLLLGIFVVFNSLSGNAQDLIVKLNGDSLHCKIDDANERFIYYITSKTKKGKRLVISRKEVVSVLYNYEEADPKSIKSTEAREYEVFQAYGMAMGSRLIQYESVRFGDFLDFDNYDDELRWGTSGLTFGMNYFVDAEYGFGLLYSKNTYENSLDVRDLVTGVTGKLSDQIDLNYFGANLAYRLSGGQTGTFFQVNVGIGYCTYRNDASVIYRYDVSGGSIGLHLMGMANFSLGYGLYIPVQLGVKGFNISQLEVSFHEGTPDEVSIPITREIEAMSFNVARLELSVGLMFAF